MSALRRVALRIAAHPVLAFWVFFALFPFIVPNRTMATQVLIFGLLAMGFNLLYGYTGLLSFGHAAYYGLGAYGAGIALAKLQRGLALARARRRGCCWPGWAAWSSASSACAAAGSTSPC